MKYRRWSTPAARGVQTNTAFLDTITIGTAVGSVLEDMQGFPLIINFIVLPLFFFSSALFPVPDLPGVMRLAVRLNPLSYGVDGLRGALNGGFVFGVATDFAVLGSLAAILLAVGAYLFSKIEV